MASGKASRRKRAAQGRAPVPPVRTRRNAGGPGSDRRLWVLGALVAAVLAAVVVGAVLAQRDGDGGGDAGATLADADAAAAVFANIPQSGLVLGDADAPVTLVEFADLQCPFCRDFAVEAVPELVEEHVRSGKVRFELRGLAFLGPDSERGLRAVLAAAQQNRMFEFAELLYYNQGGENSGWLSQDLVEAAARSLGLDVARLTDDMDSDAVSNLVREHAGEAERRGVSGTPTIFVGPTGGQLERVELESVTDVGPIDEAIAAADS